MFWFCKLESGKRYAQKVEAPYHLTMAALKPDDQKKGNVSVMAEVDGNKTLLCTLRQNTTMQWNLANIFAEGQEVTFFINGLGTVYLSGYILRDVEESEDDSLGLSGEEDDESISGASDNEFAFTPDRRAKSNAGSTPANPKGKKRPISLLSDNPSNLKQVNKKSKANQAHSDSEDAGDIKGYFDADADNDSDDDLKQLLQNMRSKQEGTKTKKKVSFPSPSQVTPGKKNKLTPNTPSPGILNKSKSTKSTHQGASNIQKRQDQPKNSGRRDKWTKTKSAVSVILL
ncbi:hypothetical protein HDE_02875 [Halotydeus destructor]|nr:hypothetical protein HDE_02875 [Halotydeus destructor]